MNSQPLLTVEGKNKIEKELEQLIRVDREAIKKALAEARALGDLKENAEYISAKEKQSHLEGKIAELQNVLNTSRVIDISTINSQRIVFGATVTLIDPEKDTTVTYQIVGNNEADSKSGKISYISPLGKALIGKEVGDTVIVRAPRGNIEYEIESFEYKKN